LIKITRLILGHLHGFKDLTVNHNGTLLATICAEDKSAKIFDIPNFDMINILKLDFSPSAACWVYQSSDIIYALAIADMNNPKIHIFDGKGSDMVHTIEGVHFKPVKKIEYNAKVDIAISIDVGGIIELWSGAKRNYEFPENKLDWSSKLDTDLYELAKLKSAPYSLKIAPDGKSFATFCVDRFIRIFDIRSGKLINKIDETLQKYIDEGKENK
jgi:peptidylprolyl isomerase domain and WD repeat-containing protein 1